MPGNRDAAATMPTTFDKAQELNLDPAVHGTFAEIGAGQETANWFFRASGSAGMRFTGRDIRGMIERGDPAWKDYVPGGAHRSVPHPGHDPAAMEIP